MELGSVQMDVQPSESSKTQDASEPSPRQLPVAHIPKKQRATAVAHSDSDGDDFIRTSSKTSISAPNDEEKIRERSMRQLEEAAQQKGIDLSLLEGWSVQILRGKPKNKPSKQGNANGKPQEPKYSVIYFSPTGCSFASKNDAVASISQPKRSSKIDRTECYRKARQYLNQHSDRMPVKLGKVLVHDFGRVDPRARYHNRVSLFPVGYCGEITDNSEALGRSVTIECVIEEGGEEGPRFKASLRNESNAEVIESRDLETMHAKVQEALVGGESTAGDEVIPRPNFNFFPLEVERALEGLEGALDCTDYLFHGERGFGITYTTDAGSQDVKKKLLREYNRDKRRNKRDSLGGIVSAKDKEERKQKEKQEKAARKLQADENKKRKLEEAVESKAQRKAADVARQQVRAEQKAKQQEVKRQQKEIEKQIQPIRRDVKADVRKRRQFARTAVMRVYDAEQDDMSQHQSALTQELSSPTDELATFDNNTGHIAATRFGLTEVELDAAIDICSCLYTFSNLLKLRESPSLDGLITALAVASAGPSLAGEEAQDPSHAQDDPEFNIANGNPDKLKAQSTFLMLDNIHIRLTKTLAPELHKIFGLLAAEEEKAPNSANKPALQYNFRLPINQLTWQELARESILLTLTKLLGFSDEDVVHVLRGKPHHRGRDRSTIRLLKYRVANRWAQFRSSDLQQNKQQEPGETLSVLADDDAQDVDAQEVEFDDEAEVAAKLEFLAADVSAPEAYRRSAKVLIRLIQHSCARNFLWEVDRSLYPEYYAVIQQPFMLVHVAKKLLLQRYGSDAAAIPRLLYADIRRVCANSLVYNTEQSNLWNQADKLVAMADRLLYSWVLGDDKPAIELLSDELCTISRRAPQPSEKFLRCGRCAASYSLEVVHPLPPESVIHSAAEDWYCHFCSCEADPLQWRNEPSSSSQTIWQSAPFGYGAVADLPEHLNPQSLSCMFKFGPWGPSSNLPWLLNSSINMRFRQLIETDEDIAALFEGVAILSSPARGSLSTSHSWTVSERIAVLKALCILLRLTTDAEKYVRTLESKCQKLMELAYDDDTRETDFLHALREVAGDDGVSLWKSVAKDFNLSTWTEADEITNDIFAGRCVHCKRPTDDDDAAAILLCDACDAEAHLACLGLKQVPSEAWYCESCQARRKDHVDDDSASDTADQNRRVYIEDSLLNSAVKMTLLSADDAIDEPETFQFGELEYQPSPNMVCAYCNLSEQDLCSPFVIGQTATEAMAHSDMHTKLTTEPIDGFDPHMPVTVGLRLNGTRVDPPAPPTPYFPLYCEENEDIDGPIVHEMCALIMERARRQFSKHETRRARQLVAEETIMLSGVNTQPLGEDRAKRLYWRFPMQQDGIFVRLPQSDIEFERENGQSETFERGSRWYLFRGVDELTTLAGWLQTQHPREAALKRRIIRLCLRSTDNSEHRGSMEIETPAAGLEEKHDSKMGRAFEIRLVTDVPQSVQVPSEVLIDMDDAAEDDDADEQFDENDDISHTQYFTFSSRSYFAVGLFEADTKVSEERTVTYEIRREQQVLSTVSANEPWSDGYYYFSSLVFRRPGKYVLNFFVEGAHAHNVVPLSFTVNVSVRTIRVGAEGALSRLAAVRGKSARATILSSVTATTNEVDIIRGALLTLQAAIPAAAYLQGSSAFPDDTTGLLEIAEAQGWNSMLQEAWLHFVTSAEDIQLLMECVLLLESFVDENWFDQGWKRAAPALAAPSYALRNATCQSVALRLFVFDATFQYDRLATTSRTQARTRSTVEPVAEVPHSAYVDESFYETRRAKRQRERIATEPIPKGRQTRNSRATEAGVSRRQVSYAEDDQDDEDDYDEDYYKPRRNTRSRTTGYQRPNYAVDDDPDDNPQSPLLDEDSQDDGQFNGDSEDEGDSTAVWQCGKCSLENVKSNLRCSSCDARRPADALATMSARSVRAKPLEDFVPAPIVAQSPVVEIDFDALINKYREDSHVTGRFLSILRRLAELRESAPFWQPPDANTTSTLRGVFDGVVADFYGSDAQAFAEDMRSVFNSDTQPADAGAVSVGRRLTAVFERLFAAWVTSEDRPLSVDLTDVSCPRCGRVEGLEGNDAIICDLCEGCFHLSCVDLVDIPKEDWFCPSCQTRL